MSSPDTGACRYVYMYDFFGIEVAPRASLWRAMIRSPNSDTESSYMIGTKLSHKFGICRFRWLIDVLLVSILWIKRSLVLNVVVYDVQRQGGGVVVRLCVFHLFGLGPSVVGCRLSSVVGCRRLLPGGCCCLRAGRSGRADGQAGGALRCCPMSQSHLAHTL